MAGATPKQAHSVVEDRSATLDALTAASPDASTDGSPGHLHGEEENDRAGSWVEWARVGLVAVVLLVVWSGVLPRVYGIDWLALAGNDVGGFPIFKEAIADLLKGRMTMELSMTIALAAASVIGKFFTALLITVFVLIAEIIEGMTVGRGRGTIRELLDLLPQTVEVRSEGQVAARGLLDVRVGDVVLVRPGGHLPVDGVVVTAFGRIIELVERAEHSRAPIEKIADRLACYLVYFALACAALTFWVTRDARSTISVIAVAGACGIAAGMVQPFFNRE